MLKDVVVLSVFMILAPSLSCNDDIIANDTTQEVDIKGSYLLTIFCMDFYSKKGAEIDTQFPAVNYDTVETGCASALVDSFLSTSTLFITADSIVRFGFHCPGSNSGTTRIAYGYEVRGDRILGDSLAGELTADGNRMKRITQFEKHDDGSITITQHGYYTDVQKDSAYYAVLIILLWLPGYYCTCRQRRHDGSSIQTNGKRNRRPTVCT